MILLNNNVDDIEGISAATELKCRLKPNPDFIIKGKPAKVIKDKIGKIPVTTPRITAQ